jgi:hypothetical protein
VVCYNSIEDKPTGTIVPARRWSPDVGAGVWRMTYPLKPAGCWVILRDAG